MHLTPLLSLLRFRNCNGGTILPVPQDGESDVRADRAWSGSKAARLSGKQSSADRRSHGARLLQVGDIRVAQPKPVAKHFVVMLAKARRRAFDRALGIGESNRESMHRQRSNGGMLHFAAAEVLEAFLGDAARTLRLPIGTVMSRLSRGRERLRGLIEGGAEPARLKVIK